MASATADPTKSSPHEHELHLEGPPSVPALDPDEVAECLKSGRPIKELLDFDDQVWETLYGFGFRSFLNAQFEQAEFWWTQACLLDSAKDRNWVALGVACKRQKKYDLALNAFSLAVHNGGKNPWAPLHAAECHLHQGNPQLASMALADAQEWAAHHDDKDAILQRIELLRRGIQRRHDKQA